MYEPNSEKNIKSHGLTTVPLNKGIIINKTQKVWTLNKDVYTWHFV